MSWHHFLLLLLLATLSAAANLKIRIGPDQSDPTRQDESDFNIKGISLTATTRALLTRIQRQENLPSESFELYTLKGRKLLSGLTLLEQTIKQNDVLRLVVLQATVYKFISNTFVQGQHKGQLWHIVEKPLHNPTTTQKFQRRLVPSSLVFDELYPNVLWSDVSIIPDHELELLEIGPPELSRNMESSTTFQILAGPTPIRRDLGVPCHSPFAYGVMSAVSFW